MGCIGMHCDELYCMGHGGFILEEDVKNRWASASVMMMTMMMRWGMMTMMMMMMM